MKPGAKVPGKPLVIELLFLLCRVLTAIAELGREAVGVGVGDSAAERADTDCRWPLIPGVGEATSSGVG